MNYVLVFITFLILAATMVGIALLGSDRVFPVRKVFDAVSHDGIETVREGEMPLLISRHPDPEEIKRIRFSTVWRGYHKDEVEETVRLLRAENSRLREQLRRNTSDA